MFFPGAPLSEVTRRLLLLPFTSSSCLGLQVLHPERKPLYGPLFSLSLDALVPVPDCSIQHLLLLFFYSCVSCHCGVYKKCRIVVFLYDHQWSDNSRPSSAIGYSEMLVTQTPHQLNATRPNKRLKWSKRSDKLKD